MAVTVKSGEAVGTADTRRRVAVWLSTIAWFAAVVLVLASLLLGFGDPTPEDPAAPDIFFVPLFTVMIGSLATVGALLALRRRENPIGWLLLAGGVLMAIATFGSEYLRFSYATGRDLPGAAVIGWLPTVVFAPSLDIGWALAFVAFTLLPLAIAVAILKYRLYNIDRLINRTLVYVPLIAILGGAFAAGIALSQKLFLTVTGAQSDAAIVMTTLIVAGTFAPIRKTIESAVDQRFRPGRPARNPSFAAATVAAASPAWPVDMSAMLDDPRLATRIEEIARRVAQEATTRPTSASNSSTSATIAEQGRSDRHGEAR